jgi:uncharacterized membrane protein HdeD (DUF308 family)
MGVFRMPHMARAILIIVYVVGAFCEIAGLLLTVQAFLLNRGDGTTVWVEPTRWERRRGPGLIIVGIIVGLAGNIASMYVLNSAVATDVLGQDGC